LKKFSCPTEASDWLKKGKILIHPTEGVWGLGCDAFNVKACQKINSLKMRDTNKNFILLAPSITAALEYLKPIEPDQMKYLKSIWPGHITVILQANNAIPDSLKSLDNTIALRVSGHLPITNLLSSFNGLMVSTSANLTNSSTSDSIHEVTKIFNDSEVAVYAHNNGTASKPSAILDLNRMEYIRE
jgi:L-threonylcarbamoyladenylate synthase|tara:strand:+ start:365 stop:922 length:558 start_codon:yes stop_codon:yes gene_type:complete